MKSNSYFLVVRTSTDRYSCFTRWKFHLDIHDFFVSESFFELIYTYIYLYSSWILKQMALVIWAHYSLLTSNHYYLMYGWFCVTFFHKNEGGCFVFYSHLLNSLCFICNGSIGWGQIKYHSTFSSLGWKTWTFTWVVLFWKKKHAWWTISRKGWSAWSTAHVTTDTTD